MLPISMNSEVASLFVRVVCILDSGRGRVLRTINHETVLAYWLIGREIVRYRTALGFRLSPE